MERQDSRGGITMDSGSEDGGEGGTGGGEKSFSGNRPSTDSFASATSEGKTEAYVKSTNMSQFYYRKSKSNTDLTDE